MSKNIYYNVFLKNDTPTELEINYKDVRAVGLLGNDSAENYKMYIERFAIPMCAVPIMIFPKDKATSVNTRVDYGKPDNGYFQIQITFAGVTRTENVIFQSLSDYDANGDVYLGIYSPQHLIDMINKALYDCAQILACKAPFLILDINRNIVDLYANIAEFREPTANYIRFNARLYELFHNFQVYYQEKIAILDRYQFIMKECGNNYVTNVRPPQLLNGTFVDAPGDFICNRGYFSTINYMNSVRKIIFTTFNIPVRKEAIPNLSNTNNIGYSSLNILTDFVVNQNGVNSVDLRGIADYYNKGENRQIDLIGSGNINNIDIRAFYQTNNGDIVPLELATTQTFTMKIKFEKKI